MGNSEPVLVDREDHIETWTLNRPDIRNAISGVDVIDSLVANCDRVNGDPAVRAVVLTGAGSAFSAGGNIKDMADGTGLSAGRPHQQRNAYRSTIQRIPRAFADCEVPVIAAVNGPAVGAGCDLALMCDLRVASEKAFFASSFVKLGLVPGDGGAWLLRRLVGPARAAEMVLTGDRLSAEQALEWGLVSRVVPAERLLDVAKELAARIAVNPPQAVRMAKTLLTEAESGTLRSSLELAASLQPLAQYTRDHKEAVAAMLDRREGEFTGE